MSLYSIGHRLSNAIVEKTNKIEFINVIVIQQSNFDSKNKEKKRKTIKFARAFFFNLYRNPMVLIRVGLKIHSPK